MGVECVSPGAIWYHNARNIETFFLTGAFFVAEFEIVVQGGDEPLLERCAYTMQPRVPFLSRRSESAFWKRVGEEVTEAAESSGLPFEAALLFLKKARRASGKRVSLCASVLSIAEEETTSYEEARTLAEEITKRNMEGLPDTGEELLSVDDLEVLFRDEFDE